MFIGHIGVALAAKAAQPRRALAGLVIASQLPDVVYSMLVPAGIEQIRVHDGVGPDAVEMVWVPFSHSLVATAVMAFAAYSVMALTVRGRERHAAGGLVAAVVLSHWVLDAVVHEPDLPLLGRGSEVGLGLTGGAGFAVEVVLVLAGLALYLRSTVPVDRLGRAGMPVLAAAMIGFGGFVALSEPPENSLLLAAGNLGAYAVLAATGQWLAGHRRAHPAVDRRPTLCR